MRYICPWTFSLWPKELSSTNYGLHKKKGGSTMDSMDSTCGRSTVWVGNSRDVRDQSPVTRQASRVMRHTPHVTRHTSHVKRHTSHVLSHTSQRHNVTRHTSHVTSHVTRHTSHVTLHHTRRKFAPRYRMALLAYSAIDFHLFALQRRNSHVRCWARWQHRHLQQVPVSSNSQPQLPTNA
jgi:hypothetical protein